MSRVFSAEHCKKLSIARRSRITTTATKEKMSYTHKLAYAEGRRISSQLGKPRSVEVRLKISRGLKGFKRPPFSEEHRKKLGESHKGQIAWNKGFTNHEVGKNCGCFICKPPPIKMGEKNPAWIADRTKLVKKQERNDSAYKDWRKSVRDRDGWKCKISNGDCLGKVVAHHILPWRDYPELRYEPNNGITLCRFHHPRKRTEEMKLSPYFTELVMSNSN